MRKIVLTFGLIAGAILVAVMLLVTIPFHDEIGFDTGLIIGYTAMVLAFLMIYFGVRTYRDNEAGGSVTFWGAFKVGALIMLIATACYVVTWEVYYFQFAPDFVDKWAASAIETARVAGATEAELAAKAQEMARFKVMYDNPLINIAYTTLEPLPVGLLFTLLTAWGLSRKRKGMAAPTT